MVASATSAQRQSMARVSTAAPHPQSAAASRGLLCSGNHIRRADLQHASYLAEKVDQIEILVPSQGVTCLQQDRAQALRMNTHASRKLQMRDVEALGALQAWTASGMHEKRARAHPKRQGVCLRGTCIHGSRCSFSSLAGGKQGDKAESRSPNDLLTSLVCSKSAQAAPRRLVDIVPIFRLKHASARQLGVWRAEWEVFMLQLPGRQY